MENPINFGAPSDPIERIHALAKDIAYGAIYLNFTSHLRVKNANDAGEFYDQGIKDKLMPKWGNSLNYYHVHLLVSFGYLVKSQVDLQEAGITFYDVTPKAFALLEKPATPPSVFISYKQSESSAFALLIESRLKKVDPNIGIFIDKNIPTGESINAQIKEALEQSRFFICLLGSRTLADSTAVQTEISLAKLEANRIIPICHNGYTPDELYTKYFDDNKAIIIKPPESAEEYEINMTRLLIKLGYSTT